MFFCLRQPLRLLPLRAPPLRFSISTNTHSSRNKLNAAKHVDVKRQDAAERALQAHAGPSEHNLPPILEAFMSLRQQNKRQVAELPQHTCLLLWQEALAAKATDIMPYLHQDLTQVPKGRFSNMMIKILNAYRALPRSAVLEIFRQFTSPGKPFSLPLNITRRLVDLAAVWGNNSSTEADAAILDIIAPTVIKLVSSAKAPKGIESLSYSPPAIVRDAFNLLYKQLELKRHDEAVTLFGNLVQTGNIPRETINTADETAAELEIIIFHALIRAYFHWGWREAASRCLGNAISSQFIQATDSVVVNSLYALLESPKSENIAMFSDLFKQTHSKSTEVRIPDALILLFYRSAHQVNRLDAAEQVYSISRSDKYCQNHEYPPPTGTAITSLMRHLVHVSRNAHMARVLATEMAQGTELIPSFDRPRFIAATAFAGHGILTQTLWERYASGRDASVLVGDSAAMLRVVLLFSQLARATEKQIALLQENDSFSTELSDMPISPIPIESYIKRLNTMNSFMGRVYEEYRELKVPVEEAHHYEISSMARALVAMGRYDEASEMIKRISHRKEKLDMVDMNIMLVAVADKSPSTASNMLRIMYDRGLRPDSISFGTVIARAAAVGDFQLVDTLGKWMQEENEPMDAETVSAIVQATIEQMDNQESGGRTAMASIFAIFRDGPPALRTVPNGRMCIKAALRAQAPVLAYKFWALMTRAQAEWDDSEEVSNRSEITEMTRKQMESCLLPRERGTHILRDLVIK